MNLFRNVMENGKIDFEYFHNGNIQKISVSKIPLQEGFYYDDLIFRGDLETTLQAIIKENDFAFLSYNFLVIDKTYLTNQVYAFKIEIEIGSLLRKVQSFEISASDVYDYSTYIITQDKPTSK
jgi:hypothetical protein